MKPEVAQIYGYVDSFDISAHRDTSHCNVLSNLRRHCKRSRRWESNVIWTTYTSKQGQQRTMAYVPETLIAEMFPNKRKEFYRGTKDERIERLMRGEG